MDAPHYHSDPPLLEVMGQRRTDEVSGCGELRARPLLHGLMGRKVQRGLMETNYQTIRVVRATAGDTKVSVCV